MARRSPLLYPSAQAQRPPNFVDGLRLMARRNDIRNIAIIAHVDHGKTTLVDALMRQSGLFRDSQLQGDCILDSNDLERERGITILAKNIALSYKGTKINIIDTPGHADFGGEVERVLKMADGVLMLVDAAEGTKPQTRFVLRKALERHLQPIVVVNKIDRPDGRPTQVLSEVFDLFMELGADDSALDFPYIFASGRSGYATHNPADREGDIYPLLDLVLEKIPGPVIDADSTFKMAVTTLTWSEFVGRIVTGRVASGTIKKGQQVLILKADGRQVKGQVAEVEAFDKLGRAPTAEGTAGDIIALTGLPEPEIGDTICDPSDPTPRERLAVDEPTLSMLFTINSSPLAGRDGKFVTSRHIRTRLMRELESNVALKVESEANSDHFKVSGRGLLHLGVLIETMRREGYELSIGKPEVIRKQIDGKWHEPFEQLTVDVPTADMGPVMELVGMRRGMLEEMNSGDRGLTNLKFLIPARGLIGLRTRVLNATRGEAIMYHRFDSYRPVEGELPSRSNGVLISQDNGKAVTFALNKLQERAALFVGPGEDVYEGMIVGENARDNDMVVNPIKEKKLTNMRTTASDENIFLAPPRKMTLEEALEYIAEDEYVEVTPAVIRMRKIFLTETDRKRGSRVKAN